MSFGVIAASYSTPISGLPHPILSYSFNEGAGNQFWPTHGTAIGWANNLQWTSGPVGHGTAAGRTTQQTYTQTLTIEDTPIIGVDSWTALSVMCWYRPLAPSGGDRGVFSLYDTSNQAWFGVVQYDNGALVPGMGADTLGTVMIPNDIWAHIGLVWDGSTVTLYIDGVVMETGITAETPRVLETIRLNGLQWSHSGGAIDDFRCFDVALTPEQIVECMNQPV